VTEVNACRISAVLSADSNFQVFSDTASFINAHFHQLTNTGLIQALERIMSKHLLF
jgi:hypothetical protein